MTNADLEQGQNGPSLEDGVGEPISSTEAYFKAAGRHPRDTNLDRVVAKARARQDHYRGLLTEEVRRRCERAASRVHFRLAKHGFPSLKFTFTHPEYSTRQSGTAEFFENGRIEIDGRSYNNPYEWPVRCALEWLLEDAPEESNEKP